MPGNVPVVAEVASVRRQRGQWRSAHAARTSPCDWEGPVIRRSGDAAKRLVDILLGTALTLAALPVIAVLALGVSISLRCWPFFIHERVGRGGRRFRIVKLRTLPPSAHRYALKPDLAGVSVPAFGRFLRRRHLDELPQLALVPVGRLSLVGPRPKLPDQAEPMDPNFSGYRTQVRQGCSGLWQIGIDAHKLIADAPEYDTFYLRHRSLRLDAWILWRTARLMAGLGPRIALADVPAWALSAASHPLLDDWPRDSLRSLERRSCRQPRKTATARRARGTA